MKKILTIITMLLTASFMTDAQETHKAFSLFGDNGISTTVNSVGGGYWLNRNLEEKETGVALTYAHRYFIVSGGINTQTWKPGYLSAGPRVVCPTFVIGDKYQLAFPLYAEIGIADFSTGRFDYGGAAGISFQTKGFGIGIMGQVTRYIHNITLQVYI